MKKHRQSLKGLTQSGRNIRVNEIYERGAETETEKVSRDKVQETEAGADITST